MRLALTEEFGGIAGFQSTDNGAGDIGLAERRDALENYQRAAVKDELTHVEMRRRQRFAGRHRLVANGHRAFLGSPAERA